MSIKEAVQKLLKNPDFQEDARHDAKLRVFRRRFLEGVNGGAGSGAAIELLKKYGYTIDVKDSKRK